MGPYQNPDIKQQTTDLINAFGGSGSTGSVKCYIQRMIGGVKTFAPNTILGYSVANLGDTAIYVNLELLNPGESITYQPVGLNLIGNEQVIDATGDPSSVTLVTWQTL